MSNTSDIGRDNSGTMIGGDLDTINNTTNYNSTNSYNNYKKEIPRVLLSLLGTPQDKLIGRQESEDYLYGLLTHSDSEPKKIVLQSLGGIGKTSLAKNIYNRCFADSHFKHLIWINADDEQSIYFIAQELGIDTEQERWVHKLSGALANLPSPCLAIIDNLTQNTQKNFSELINSSNWHILATSRHKLNNFKEELLEPLSEDACVELYIKFCGFDDDIDTVRQVVQKAGYHTLAIELLGKTAAASEKSATDLLESLDSYGFDLSTIYKETVDACYGQSTENIEDLLYNHIKILFNLASLKEEHSIILRQIAILGSSAHRSEYLEKWLSLESKSPLQNLTKLGWLQANTYYQNHQSYTLHPIVADIALREIIF